MKFVSFRQDKSDKEFYFMLHEKQGESWIVTEKHKQFVGSLLNVEFGSYEYGGEKVQTIAFFFDADGTTFKIECNWNVLTRSIINTMASVPDAIKEGRQFLIRTWNDGNYNKVFVKFNDSEDRLDWLVPVKDQPEIKRATFGGKTMIDDTDVNRFFSKIVKEKIMPVCPGLPERKDDGQDQEQGKPAAAKPKETQWPEVPTIKDSFDKEKVVTQPSTDLPDDDDLPF